jgi:hypothetical protein
MPIPYSIRLHTTWRVSGDKPLGAQQKLRPHIRIVQRFKAIFV